MLFELITVDAKFLSGRGFLGSFARAATGTTATATATTATDFAIFGSFGGFKLVGGFRNEGNIVDLRRHLAEGVVINQWLGWHRAAWLGDRAWGTAGSRTFHYSCRLIQAKSEIVISFDDGCTFHSGGTFSNRAAFGSNLGSRPPLRCPFARLAGAAFAWGTFFAGGGAIPATVITRPRPAATLAGTG
ncbi:MAG: hypothetical protein C0478_04915 [Planctomyces sp.]|nr:hypothetical protein [Planctomyces sp.]